MMEQDTQTNQPELEIRDLAKKGRPDDADMAAPEPPPTGEGGPAQLEYLDETTLTRLLLSKLEHRKEPGLDRLSW